MYVYLLTVVAGLAVVASIVGRLDERHHRRVAERTLDAALAYNEVLQQRVDNAERRLSGALQAIDNLQRHNRDLGQLAGQHKATVEEQTVELAQMRTSIVQLLSELNRVRMSRAQLLHTMQRNGAGIDAPYWSVLLPDGTIAGPFCRS